MNIKYLGVQIHGNFIFTFYEKVAICFHHTKCDDLFLSCFVGIYFYHMLGRYVATCFNQVFKLLSIGVKIIPWGNISKIYIYI
jgi:hypothetical protein